MKGAPSSGPTLSSYRGLVRIAEAILADLGFAPEEMVAIFGDKNSAWDTLRQRMNEKFDADAWGVADTILSIQAGLDAVLGEDAALHIKWISAERDDLGGNSFRQVMLVGPKGVEFVRRAVGSMVGDGFDLGPVRKLTPALLKQYGIEL